VSQGAGRSGEELLNVIGGYVTASGVGGATGMGGGWTTSSMDSRDPAVSRSTVWPLPLSKAVVHSGQGGILMVVEFKASG
jgi:hypothetical protein